ncbi:ribosomal RNA processing protein 1 homolog [Harmonia axyridis]|uniref:ribosomal RNA processing protein 1 homolog n=1 Tax=Harmonia axyridis TaxID=115357 RepID=UPI001E2782EA|nr:ribosomal RNA processing protein 1 homolog [Harmonia axyridis]
MAIMNPVTRNARSPGHKSNQNDEDEKKTLLIAQELKIARSLAGNDQILRDRALKSLKKWFQRRSQNLAFTEDDFIRLWKGLFYSMWMSDKPLIQEECAENIASLLHELPMDHSLILFKCGLITLCKEWFGIDQLRLDKFLMFVRRLLRQALIVLKRNEFQKESIIKFGDILLETVLDSNKKDILGLFLHFTEIFLEELAKISEGNLNPHLLNEFLVPFMKTLAVTDDYRKIKQIRKFIFIHLMSQSDVGLEYQERYNAWKKQGFPGTIHGMQKVELEEEQVSEDEIVTSESKPLDPRAGRVDVELPQIKFSPKMIADLLIKYKYFENSKVAGRKAMNLLSKQFRKLSKGIYPLGVVDLRLPKDDIKDMNVRKAVNRLVKFEKKLLKRKHDVGEKEQKKRKLENISQTTCSENGSLQKVEPFLNFDKFPKNGEGKPIIDISSIPKKYLRMGISFNEDPATSKLALPKSFISETGKMPELLIEQFSGLWSVYNECPKVPKTTYSKKKDKIISNGIQKKKKTLKTKNKQNKVAMMKAIDSLLDKGKETAKSENRKNFSKNPWDEPLKEGEYELTIPSKSYVEKLKKISKKSTLNLQQLIDNSLIKFKDPKERDQCSTPEKKRTKKVNINTSLNQSQEFDEYHSLILSSPNIVFDGSKKPGKPLLKRKAKTPVNPFFKKNRLHQ